MSSDPAAAADILKRPTSQDRAKFAPGFGRRFLVTVDTEEEFDWTKPLERSGHGLAHIPRLAKFQSFCEGFDIAPVYLVDFPIVNDPRAVEAIGEAVAAGRAEIGVQLHPWVSPPHDEAVTPHNSFAGNLPPELERAKFEHLRQSIEQAFGQAPRIYRAGRYGVGAATAAILSDGGIAIDSSVRTDFDYQALGGPDFRGFPLHPWWIDRSRGLLEMPLTSVFTGRWRHSHGAARRLWWACPPLRGIMARTGLLERIPLTPEGVNAREAIRGIDAALAQDVPVLVFSFHSPSLRPGHTPYVRDAFELDQLYDWWRIAFAHLHARGVRPTSVAQILAGLDLPSRLPRDT